MQELRKTRWLMTPLLLVSGFGWAEEWMKQDDPNELGYYVSVSADCPFSAEDITNSLEGEFLWACIKPVSYLNLANDGALYLNVSARCIASKVGGRHVGNVTAWKANFALDVPGADLHYSDNDHGYSRE